uniref:Uncharacterized protein n=1 Tax=Anguilla anguilla TaxID=7936 RepID=A0A0E9UNR1_ANGAN
MQLLAIFPLLFQNFSKNIIFHNFSRAWKLHFKFQLLFQVFHDRTNPEISLDIDLPRAIVYFKIVCG